MVSDFEELRGDKTNTRPKDHGHAINMGEIEEFVSGDKNSNQSREGDNLLSQKEQISNVSVIKDRKETLHDNENAIEGKPSQVNGSQRERSEKYDVSNTQEDLLRKGASNSEAKSSTKSNLTKDTSPAKEANNSHFRTLPRKVGGINTLTPIDENHDPAAAAKSGENSDDDSSSGEESRESLPSDIEKLVDPYRIHKEREQSDHRYSQTLKTSAQIDKLHAMAADLPICRQNYEIR
eukprot:CAMPEP_0185272518 /NCGR_PEP_ID=MMETSP1359-20130426/47341_1 /TAXON_ID=552665 /ORGANISM="Bigelowiella longifila, Strain CCMP242" /LENGTH=235 /DNA_ID=CAMNT_0027864823 /DNA_START=71 /DNA_END=778 /DNA_ORIENTATION=-